MHCQDRTYTVESGYVLVDLDELDLGQAYSVKTRHDLGVLQCRESI